MYAMLVLAALSADPLPQVTIQTTTVTRTETLPQVTIGTVYRRRLVSMPVRPLLAAPAFYQFQACPGGVCAVQTYQPGLFRRLR